MKKLDTTWSPEQIVEEGTYLRSMKTGIWIEFYANGNLRSKMEYKNNRPNGACTLYYENGHIRECGNWIGTRWTGDYRVYYPNDSLRFLFHYNQLGQRDGIQFYYYPTGKLWFSSNLKANKEDGWTREYDETGKVLTERYYSIYPDSCKFIDHRNPDRLNCPADQPEGILMDHRS